MAVIGEEDLGVDIWVLPDLEETGDRLAAGYECLGQDLLIRLDTPRGSLAVLGEGLPEEYSLVDYGYDLKSQLNRKLTSDELLEIAVSSKVEVEKDDRVLQAAARVVVEAVGSARSLYLYLSVETDLGPFEFTFAATKDSVQRITQAAA